MTHETKHIRRILLTFLMGVLSIGCLLAQTANDSVASKKLDNGLMDAFEGLVFDDDDLPQYEDETDSIAAALQDSIAARYAHELFDGLDEEYRIDTYFERFNPTPAKAVWMSALFPGGGQIYNRKYWKLPIIYGGFLGLLYGYNWNQRYFKTYQSAYRDLMTGSPNASYMAFLHGRTQEWVNEPSNHSWLETTFARKRNTYRNWRDYCVVGMIGVYLVAMVDAYVDASLYHFDVSPELDAYCNPSMMVSYKIDF